MKKFNKNEIENCFKFNPHSEKAVNAIKKTLQRFSPVIKNFIIILDDEADGCILFLFPLNELNKAGKEIKEIVLTQLRTQWKAAGFKILEDRPQLNDTYRIGFMSYVFRISPHT